MVKESGGASRVPVPVGTSLISGAELVRLIDSSVPAVAVGLADPAAREGDQSPKGKGDDDGGSQWCPFRFFGAYQGLSLYIFARLVSGWAVTKSMMILCRLFGEQSCG